MNDWRVGQKLMMKYSHKPQPNSPLEKELATKQLDNVVFVSRHDENWIVVRSAEGEEGCVPDKYVMVIIPLYLHFLCKSQSELLQLFSSLSPHKLQILSDSSPR